MPENQKYIIIGGIIVVILLIIGCVYFNKQSNEYFSPYESQKELDEYYQSPIEGIKDYLVDTMTCSKKCCGDQWPVPFEGLSAEEIQQSIQTPREPGPFVRTNYTCANGIEGVGCPCISKDAYRFIVNKGRNEHNIDSLIQIEPTFLISGNEPKRRRGRGHLGHLGHLGHQIHRGMDGDQHTPYQTLQAYRSMFVDTPRLNDIELSRGPNPVNDVESIHYKSSSAGY